MFKISLTNGIQNFTFILFCLILSQNIHAATITWLGGNDSWFNPNAWDTGVIPKFDDEIIIPSGHLVIPASNAKCFNILISTGAVMTIEATANLFIGTDLGQNGIENHGTLTNYGGLYITNLSSGHTGIENHNDFSNKGILEITDFLRGLNNLSSGDLNLSGSCHISNGIEAISNDGTINNNETLIIKNLTYAGIINKSSSTFSNSGTIEISQIGNSQNSNNKHAIINRSSFVNYPFGIIDIFDITTTAGVLSVLSPSALFTNRGEININDIKGIGSIAILVNEGTFINDKNALLNITDIRSMGILVYSKGLFRNKGDLTIMESGAGSTMINIFGSFVNHQLGSISLTDAGGHGIWILDVNGEYTNYGLITINNPTLGAVHSFGKINNKPKGYFITNGNIACFTGSSFLNQGHMDNFYKGSHSCTTGTFTNTGALGDRDEGFNGMINNQSVRVIPFQAPVSVGAPIVNALDLGSLNYVDIQSWTTTPSGNISAGTYLPVYNTFTPNANAVGLTTIYVSIRINNLNNNIRKYAIPIPGGVQPFTGDGGSSSMQTNGNDLTKGALLRKENSITENNFNAYPNPVRDVLFVETENVPGTTSELVLSNSLGQQVLRETISSDTPKTSLTIPPTLPNGTYVLSYRQNGALVYSKHLVIAR